MKSNERNPSNNRNPSSGNPGDNSLKGVPTAPGDSTPAVQSIPKSDLQPNSPPTTASPNIATGKPHSVKTADSNQPAAPSLGKGRDAQLPTGPKANKDANVDRWQQPT